MELYFPKMRRPNGKGPDYFLHPKPNAMKRPFKVGLEEAVAQLHLETNHPFTTVMRHGSMSVEYYAPRIKDLQTPHLQDELYIIISGKAFFMRGEQKTTCMSGDLLFVPAHTPHRFENFTDDFATWVVFYGPVNGESDLQPR